MKIKFSNWLLFLFILAFLGCSKPEKNNGYIFEKGGIESLKKGMTKEDTIRIMGYPSINPIENDKIFYYIGLKNQVSVLSKAKNIERKLAIITFDHHNVITNINYSEDFEPKELSFSENFTPSYGDDSRLIKKLFGNIGRFNKKNKKTN